jgi:hypothetical protein
MRLIPLIAGLILTSTLILADGQSVDFDPQVDFAKFKTFSIHEARLTTGKPEIDNPLYARRISEVIRGELTKKGLKEMADQPDLFVEISISGENFSTVGGQRGYRVPDGPNGQRGYVVDGTGPIPVRYTEGTLTLDLIVRESTTLAWRGIYHEQEDNASQVARKLPDDTRKLLAVFPPRK